VTPSRDSTRIPDIYRTVTVHASCTATTDSLAENWIVENIYYPTVCRVSHVSPIRAPVARTTDGRKTRKEKGDGE